MAFSLPDGGGAYVPKKIKAPNIIGGPTGVYSPAAPLKPKTAGQITPALQQPSVPAGAVRSGEGFVSANPPSVGVSQAPSYDYSKDPVLVQIKAGSAKSRDEARAAELAARKRLAILFGSAQGIVDDTGTAESAQGNTFSTLAEIARGYERAQKGTDEAYNKRNLFFGGHRGQALARLLEDRGRQEYGARQSVQDEIARLGRELALALSGFDARDAEAEADAANRAIARAQTYGLDYGAPTAPSPIVSALTPAQDPRINPIFYFK